MVFCCTGRPHFIYPFINWWTFGLFSLFWLLWITLLWSSSTSCVNLFFISLGYILTSGIAGSNGNTVTFWGTATLFFKLTASLQQQRMRFPVILYPCLHLLPFVCGRHSSRCEVVSHFDFDLHFSGGRSHPGVSWHRVCCSFRVPPYCIGDCSLSPWNLIWNLVRNHKDTFSHSEVHFGMSSGSISGSGVPVHYCRSLPGALLWKSLFLLFHFPFLSYTDMFSPVQCWDILQDSCFLFQWQDWK